MICDAHLSPCGVYRYELTRDWDRKRPTMTVVGLNPSTADGSTDDPTLRRLLGFAQRDGFGALRVLNVFAFRATDPTAMVRAHQEGVDTVGPENDRCLASAVGAVVVAWGSFCRQPNPRTETVLSLLPHDLWCWGTSGPLRPRHPLYLHGSTALVAFRGRPVLTTTPQAAAQGTLL